MTLQEVRTQFPKVTRKQGYPYNAASGWLPMEWVEANEDTIKKLVTEHKLRRIYRGPRGRNGFGKCEGWTYKSQATHMVLYYRSGL